MSAFEYTALDVAGREQRGVLEGDSPKQIRQLLREQQLLPLNINEVAAQQARGNAGWFRFGSGINATEVALLTRQLATLVRAGLPLEESLLAVSQQSENPAVQRVLAGARSRVMEGHSLAHALADFPKVFPEIYRATVAAGEQSGRLEVVLERLADYTENRDHLRQRVMGAMLYPIVLTIMCLGIIGGLLTYVVPKVVDVFASSKAKLPLMTRMLLEVSDFLRNYGLWLLLILVLTTVLFLRWVDNPKSRFKVDLWLLRLPFIGRLLRGFNNARFARTFSILTNSAVPVLDALRISGSVITNLPMRSAINEATDRVREGSPIGRSLSKSKLFPPMTVHLISSGESSGTLGSMLERAAENQERELDSTLTTLIGLLGPMLIIIMGLFVLAIVFAMLLPIFELNTLIR